MKNNISHIDTPLLLQKISELSPEKALDWAQTTGKDSLQALTRLVQEALSVSRQHRRDFLREQLALHGVPAEHIEPLVKALYMAFKDLHELAPLAPPILQQRVHHFQTNHTRKRQGTLPFLAGIGMLSCIEFFRYFHLQIDRKEELEELVRSFKEAWRKHSYQLSYDEFLETYEDDFYEHFGEYISEYSEEWSELYEDEDYLNLEYDPADKDARSSLYTTVYDAIACEALTDLGNDEQEFGDDHSSAYPQANEDEWEDKDEFENEYVNEYEDYQTDNLDDHYDPYDSDTYYHDEWDDHDEEP